jgi:hypothetical protein
MCHSKQKKRTWQRTALAAGAIAATTFLGGPSPRGEDLDPRALSPWQRDATVRAALVDDPSAMANDAVAPSAAAVWFPVPSAEPSRHARFW